MRKTKKVPGLFLAAVPLLFQTLDGRRAFLMGALVTFAFWGCGYFFAFTRSFFPKPLAVAGPFLGVIVLAQACQYLGLEPMWILSLFLLFPFSFIKQPPRRFPKEPQDFFWIKRGLVFWALMTALGIGHEILGKGLGLFLFQSPAGSWLLLALAVAAWPSLSGLEPAAIKAGKAGA